MKLAVESLPFHDFPLEVMAETIMRLGFKWVNLWASAPPLAAHVDVVKDDPGRVAHKLKGFGLSPVGITMYGKPQEEILHGIAFAGALGAERVIFDCEANFPDFIRRFLPPLLAAAERQGVDICVENHLTVPFTPDFEQGGHEEERWQEGVDTYGQIKELVTKLDYPNLQLCLAPPHLWVMDESIIEVATFLLERRKLGYYYIWDVSRSYRRGVDGLNFGPGEEQLPRPAGTLDHGLLLKALARLGYRGYASLKCHGTQGWPLEKVKAQVEQSRNYILRSVSSDVLGS